RSRPDGVGGAFDLRGPIKQNVAVGGAVVALVPVALDDPPGGLDPVRITLLGGRELGQPELRAFGLAVFLGFRATFRSAGGARRLSGWPCVFRVSLKAGMGAVSPSPTYEPRHPWPARPLDLGMRSGLKPWAPHSRVFAYPAGGDAAGQMLGAHARNRVCDRQRARAVVGAALTSPITPSSRTPAAEE